MTSTLQGFHIGRTMLDISLFSACCSCAVTLIRHKPKHQRCRLAQLKNLKYSCLKYAQKSMSTKLNFVQRSSQTITLHTRKIPSYSLKKSRPLWPVMMDDPAPSSTHKRRKLVITYKMGSLENGLWVAEACGETYFKNDKRATPK